jgi:voltage-gated potassium channel
VTPRRLSDLEQRERRKALSLTIATVVIAWILIIGAYYVLPIGHESGARAIVRLFIDIALVGAVLVWQMRRIVRADLPEVRAMEALGIIAAFFLAIVSSLYLSMSHASPTTFTEPLDHTRALYLTITIFSTVGFGDITPKTDLARILVSIQMLLDLVIIGVVVRLLITVARSQLGQRDQDSPNQS